MLTENGTCSFKNNEANVVSFYNDLEIREDVVDFPPGATIISRCVHAEVKIQRLTRLPLQVRGHREILDDGKP